MGGTFKAHAREIQNKWHVQREDVSLESGGEDKSHRTESTR